MATALIGWGSLLWDPRQLQHLPPWQDDGPYVPVEFARRARDGRVTLVVVAGYPNRVRAFWATSSAATPDAAASDLARRERSARHDIHLVRGSDRCRGDGTALDDPISRTVQEWLAERTRITSAVWTGLPATRFRVDDTLIPQVVSYVAGLSGETLTRAREYVERAPPSVDTPVRRALEAEFGWERRELPAGVVDRPG